MLKFMVSLKSKWTFEIYLGFSDCYHCASGDKSSSSLSSSFSFESGKGCPSENGITYISCYVIMTILFFPLFSLLLTPLLAALILKLVTILITLFNILTLFFLPDDIALQFHRLARFSKPSLHSTDPSAHVDNLDFVKWVHPSDCGIMYVNEYWLRFDWDLKKFLWVSVAPDNISTTIINLLDLWILKLNRDHAHVNVGKRSMELIQS